jgi:hypothetical protein
MGEAKKLEHRKSQGIIEINNIIFGWQVQDEFLASFF